MKCRVALLCLSAIFSSQAISQEPSLPTMKPLRILTEHVNLTSFLDEKRIASGPTTELVRLLANRLQEQVQIELMPWARALHIASIEPRTALFETAMTKERDAVFKWVGPLKIYHLGIYGRKDKVSPYLPIDRYGFRYSACESRDSAYLKQWQAYGFGDKSRMILSVDKNQCRNLFIQGRADLIIWNDYFVDTLNLELAKQGTELIKIASIADVFLYIAFSKEHTDEYIARWQHALNESYLDGSMRRLYQGIFPEGQITQLEQWAKNHPAKNQSL